MKNHSSSQVLQDSSITRWFKLLFFNRKLHERSWPSKPVKPKSEATCSKHLMNRGQGGYSLGYTLEGKQDVGMDKLKSPISINRESRKDKYLSNTFNGSGNSSSEGSQKEWINASSSKSSLIQAEEWLKGIGDPPPLPTDDDEICEESVVFPSMPETSRLPTRRRTTQTTSRHRCDKSIVDLEEALHANSVIESLKSSSTSANICGMRLKVIPIISGYSALRDLNLSSNFIVHIAAQSLPKGLHRLNLSRNKIVTIDGLRELTRLRVLDLSYNCISQIGRGLSNCILIKELYLAGNKISRVEGLHRLFKLTVIDLSFNKISTIKALHRLIANYNSLLDLNLLENPIQRNMGNGRLGKEVSGLLQRLLYLNGQALTPRRSARTGVDNERPQLTSSNAIKDNGGISTKRNSQGRPSSSSGHIYTGQH